MNELAIDRIRLRGYPEGTEREDHVAVEEPLEIRVGSEPLAVLMRTPGRDRDLVAGFLLTEGVIDGLDDLHALAPCTDPSRPHAENVFVVRLAAGCRVSQARRSIVTSASCGVCGKATIESLHQRIRPFSSVRPLDRAALRTAARAAGEQQTVFRRTGGLHAAVLVTGDRVDLAEDVGRHNAVDKVLGAALLEDRLPLPDALLWVSGRAGFEIVQKALVAGVPGLACVGAPSSLAVRMAAESGMTLLGFCRDDRFNVYSGAVSANDGPG